MGQRLGLKYKIRAKTEPCPVLERAYQKKSKISHKELEALAKKAEMGVRQVERWMRRRLNLDKPTTLAKFSESG